MLPKIITSSVIRSSQQGESHGGVYIVDFNTEQVQQVIDWNTVDINWEGRGLDRGLRGIAFYDEKIILAASNEIFFFDLSFNIIESYKNKYLNHCHEIHVEENVLYITSTGYNSILCFDLEVKRFIKGYHIRYYKHKSLLSRLIKKYFDINPRLRVFDPNSSYGPGAKDQNHINNVSFWNGWITVSGTGLDHIFGIKENEITKLADIPYKTHNAAIVREDTVMTNNTRNDCVQLINSKNQLINTFNIPRYPEEELLRNNIPKDHARQGFGRGLTFFGDRYLIGGSSPATASLYDMNSGELVKSINITMDVRNAIHGLEVWPFD